ncbi:uncharacterized protein LOC129616394 [Condylostylus longicornis]|uniref:uncharacterized protein LOC129616394 n=1 Tax=Condylostylus longicornis TaxID=2530218 RepID=UPI00244E0BF4|nr:uncharacterized protein LOC129616394 [Condylostylus longicornis]
MSEILEECTLNTIPFEIVPELCKTTESMLLSWGLEDLKIIATADTVSGITKVSSWINTISAPSSPSIADSTTLNLEETLESNLNGRNILKNYNKNKYLTNQDRQYIITTIAEFWVNLERRIIDTDYKIAIEQILLLFPTENQEVYIGNKAQRGRLAEKYYNLCKKLQKEGIVKSRYQRKRKFDINASEELDLTNLVDEQSITNNPELENHHIWLKNNFFPDNIVVEKWNLTFNLRRQDVLNKGNSQDFFVKWPILTQQIAVSLIEIDFERLYPKKNILLLSKWKIFNEKIVSLYSKEIKDSQNKQLLEIVQGNLDEDSRNFILLTLLNTILKPQLIKDGRKSWKPSILDGQKALFMHVTQKCFIQSSFNIKKEEYMSKNLTVQPTIVVVGEVEEKLKFYTYFNDTLYNADNFMKAFAFVFQLHQVLNLKYDPQCRQIWNFAEEFFFELPMSYPKTPALAALLSYLNCEN